MNKFWKWMRFTKNCVSTHELSQVESSSIVIKQNGVMYFGKDTINKLPRTMLIGFMIEYLLTIYCLDISLNTYTNIDVLYSWLEMKIEEKDYV